MDVCRHDEATGWCLCCGMTRKDPKHWTRRHGRAAILAALATRLLALAAAGRPTGKPAKQAKG